MSKILTLTLLFSLWAVYEVSGGGDGMATAEGAPAPRLLPDEVALARAEAFGAERLIPALRAPAAPAAPATPATPDAAPASFPVLVATLSEEEFAARTGLGAPAPALTDVVQLAGETRTVAGSRVNMRAGPGTDYGVITSWPGGTEVVLLETDGNWGRISVGGREGWMSTRLLNG
ncbi:SH3 domain-containing protein [Hasllibacter halocynthiae]|uniref:SH3 domain-containing protein n=1 Tax=Hasllibacter halocynthiae TaxID=595589 RepID=A0A2T0X3C7_9RHOB|nr:SH3 domain-containing protein [Hasllibacter halocynthiae]PRY93452.1 SH3 domain-containing protein [Hasllibacter halocynthiae]